MERAHTPLQEGRVLAFKGLHLARGGSEADPDPAGVLSRHLKTCILERHFRRSDAELGDARHPLCFASIDIRCRLKISDFPRDLAGKGRRIKMRDAADSRAPLDQSLPEGL